MKRPLDARGDCAADRIAELSNPIGELPALSAIQSEALRILESKECAASFERQLTPSKVSLQERIMTASRKVPSPLRLEPEELEPGSFGKHAAINSELIMAEALGCLKDFRCQSAKGEKDIHTTWSQDSPPASQIEADITPPCTPVQPPCRIDQQCSLEEQPNVRSSPSQDCPSQGAAKLHRSASTADVSRHSHHTCSAADTCRPFASCLALEGFQVPTRSSSLDSGLRTVQDAAVVFRDSKEVCCSQVNCFANFDCSESLELHETPCIHRSVQCHLCGQHRPLRQLGAHVQGYCSLAEVSCPKEGCGWSGGRDFLKTHLDEVCLSVVVPCAFAASGCPTHVPRGQLGSHLAEDLGNHLLLVAHENRLLRNKIQKMGEFQTLLQTRVENLETVALLSDQADEDDQDDAVSECSSASNARFCS